MFNILSENSMINRIKTFSFIVVIILLQACAAKQIPPLDQLKAELQNYTLPKLPEEGKALVYVVRPSPVAPIVKFNVFLDDQLPESEMGYTRNEQYIYFNVTPGVHRISSKAENWAEIEIEAKNGDIYFIQQNPEMGIIMARNSIAQIQPLEGKYRVKHLELGTIIKTDK